MKKKYIWLVLAFLAFAGAVFSLFAVWKQEQEKEQTRLMYERMRQEVKIEIETEEIEETEMGLQKEKKKKKLVVPVDFKQLQKENPDIYAWITIPGTVIDYPVVQHPEDDSFYLKRTVEKEEGIAGSIYTERANKKDFSDFNTVLYGHNMKDGTMFSGLHQYEDDTYWEDHKYVTIYTPDAIRHYRIFAAYLYDDRHLLQSYDFSRKDVCRTYLDEIWNLRSLDAVTDQTVKVDEDDRILTLSTCHGMGNAYRYLVHAVLIKEEK